ncbi:MAG: hypothetical protein ABI335_04810 [Polyangiaceae bacterium]
MPAEGSLGWHVQPGDPLHTFALLGLGTISRRLREAGEVARADAIVAGLVQGLAAATAVEDQMDALRGIANSGASSAFDAVKPFLQAKEPRVESAANRATPRPASTSSHTDMIMSTR